MNCFDEYVSIYAKSPTDIAFCPYRICTLGAHIDHQLGRINGLAIDKGIQFAYSVKHSGICELRSMNFPEKRAQFHVNSIPAEKENDWADHLRGAALKLREKHRLEFGVAGVLEGDLPIGGLSSSAAVIIVFLSALCKANGIHLSDFELIRIAQEAENDYVGVSCGKLDQSCEVLCRKNCLLSLDTKDDTYELIPDSENMPPYRIAVFFSGLERSLANSSYNARVDECRAAAYALKAYAGIPYGKYAGTSLRDVPKDVFLTYKDRLPDAWRRRAEHYYSEYDRVVEGTEAWRRGDLVTYGRLIRESGYSSVHSYECGCPELISLYEIISNMDGVYGGRFSGAGFKGCCMALIDPAYTESIAEKVEKEYLHRFPLLIGKYAFTLCNSADGVRFEN